MVGTLLRMMTPGAYEDRQNLYTRLLGLRVTAIVLFVFMGSAFWALQVLNAPSIQSAPRTITPARFRCWRLAASCSIATAKFWSTIAARSAWPSRGS